MEKTNLIGHNIANTPMESHLDLWSEDNTLYENVKQYRKMIRKFIYLTIIRPEISFIVKLKSQFIHKPRKIHYNATPRIRSYIKALLERGYYVKNMDMFKSLPLQILDMQETKAIKSLPLIPYIWR